MMANLETRKRLGGMKPEDIKAEEIELAIKFEIEEWDKKRLNVAQMVTFNLFNMDAILSTLVDTLVEHELTTQEIFGLNVNRKILENLRFHRANLEVAILQARITEGINNPRIMDQFGKPLNG
jgi:hypothetical protein